MVDIAHNLRQVLERIEKAARGANRRPEEIKLVAVSKTVDLSRVKEAITAGVSILGENYIQEAREKIAQIGHGVEWHMIGHLQTNKAKYVVKFFDMVQSVDSLRIAEELDKQAQKLDKIIKVLIQVNFPGNGTKFGVTPSDVSTLLYQISGMERLAVEGLMIMPPYFTKPEKARPYFKALRQLKEKLEGKRIKNINLRELSMGMSHDFEVAIEEGATMVRVGTAIFGERKQAI